MNALRNVLSVFLLFAAIVCSPASADFPRGSVSLDLRDADVRDVIWAFSKEHKKIILYSVPGKEPFYRKFGFRRMLTAMAIFENQAQALERGYVSES